ncbi:unnamed protein product [Lactuca virosa]|uniref:No apical meristem-associated C-terminal domain-containing protein n=1 Tax=Lactuca virosa TaxID=75947 RepID=A0AAU9P0C9_9ASTR|nr:unnamed protein product [Lactuca virosa]
MKKSWEWLKDHAKWALVTKVDEDFPPPSSKRTKTSSSNAHTISSNEQYPPGFPQQQQPFNIEDSLRKIKGKKTASSSSTQMKCLISLTKLPASKLQRQNRDNGNEKKNYVFSKPMNK